MDQAVEEKTNKDPQIPSGTKGYSLNQVQWYCTP